MRGLAMKTILAAIVAGTSVLAAAEATARDRWDKWDRWEHRHGHKHRHWHDDDRPRRVIVERPVIVERSRPVLVERTRPVLMAPMMPAYPAYSPPPMDPSVNFNFSFPMR